MKRVYLLLVIVFCSVSCFAQAERALKRKVAIGRFSNETQYAKSVFYDKDNDPMGKQASDILSTRLASTEKFLLIERQDYDKIVSELDKSGEVSQNIGADFLIIGSITEFGRKTIGKSGMFTERKEQIVEAAVTLRLVDVSTGLIIFSGEAKGEASVEDKTVMGMGKTADYDATLADKAISAAISKLVENVMNKCMDSQWKAYILSVEDGSYIMSGGKSQGIQAGDTFAVLERGKKVKNPQTGLFIELPGKAVATLKVDLTLGDTPESEISFCSLVDGAINQVTLENYLVTEKK